VTVFSWTELSHDPRMILHRHRRTLRRHLGMLPRHWVLQDHPRAAVLGFSNLGGVRISVHPSAASWEEVG
jgi:hypothetical protein